MKYIVMETRQSYAVLLDERGEFKYAANLNYTVGDTVTDPVLMGEAKEPKRNVIPFAAKAGAAAVVVAAIAALLFIFIRGGQVEDVAPSQTVASQVYISINPEVRLDINENGEVIEIAGLNKEGRELSQSLENDSTRIAVLEALVDESLTQEYLTEGGNLRIGIDADNAHYKQYKKEFTEVLDSYKDQGVNFSYEIVDLRNPDPVEEEPESESKPKPEPAPEPAPVVEDDDDDDDDDDDEDDDDDDDDDEDEDDDDDDEDEDDYDD